MVVLISTIIVDTVNGDEDDGDDEGDGGAMVRGGGVGAVEGKGGLETDGQGFVQK